MEEKTEFCPAHSGVVQQLTDLEDSFKTDRDEQWEAINYLRNRLPNWASLLIGLLMGLLGASATYASLAVKLSQVP